MALINVQAREIHCKLVYYGPGMSGKTTNLVYLHGAVNAEARGELVSIATANERTLFFDFLPLDLGTVHGFRVRFHLYTVPGQVLYERTRIAVLNGADGVIFVADSQRSELAENIASMKELAVNLKAQGKPLLDFPAVLQYNKRDLEQPLSTAALDYFLNPLKLPRFEAVAAKGVGVFDTVKALSRLVMAKL